VYRSDDDIRLLGELAGVLDQTVAAGGLSAGSYLVLRELARAPEGTSRAVGSVAEALGADGDEVAALAGRLVQDGLAEARPDGVAATTLGRGRAASLEESANEAMRAYVMERPHTATVYGLVASMQAGRFTVEDLIAFIAEGPGVAEDDEPG
jgi:DNA-binding MarR family transcriptional regulator